MTRRQVHSGLSRFLLEAHLDRALLIERFSQFKPVAESSTVSVSSQAQVEQQQMLVRVEACSKGPRLTFRQFKPARACLAPREHPVPANSIGHM